MLLYAALCSGPVFTLLKLFTRIVTILDMCVNPRIISYAVKPQLSAKPVCRARTVYYGPSMSM